MKDPCGGLGFNAAVGGKKGQRVTETRVGGYKSMQFLSNVVMPPTLNNHLRPLDRWVCLGELWHEDPQEIEI